jgi:hypothetical protein
MCNETMISLFQQLFFKIFTPTFCDTFCLPDQTLETMVTVILCYFCKLFVYISRDFLVLENYGLEGTLSLLGTKRSRSQIWTVNWVWKMVE